MGQDVDTLPLGILVEAIGKRLPIVAMPVTNPEHAAHPAFAENIARLRSWGVTVLTRTRTGREPGPAALPVGPGPGGGARQLGQPTYQVIALPDRSAAGPGQARMVLVRCA